MTPGWSVYLLQCADGTLYTGIAKDVQKRLEMHEAGKGAKYTRGRGPFEILYAEPCAGRGSALKREAEIKALGKSEKLALVKRMGPS
jgi:putative endonuclease